MEGMLPEEAIESRLAQARRAEGPDAAGFVQLIEVMQELGRLRPAELEPDAGLRLLGRLVHAVAATPFLLVTDPSHLLRLGRFCAPFLVVHSNGMTSMPAELQVPSAPIAADLWPQPTSAATALRAAVAAFALMVSRTPQAGVVAPHKLCTRLVAELGKPEAEAAVQAGLEAMQSAASTKDLLFVAHFILDNCAAAQLAAVCPGFHADSSAGRPLNQAGQQAATRWRRAAAGLTEVLPRQPEGYDMCAEACIRTGAWDEAVRWAERGVRVADEVGSSYHGAKLRNRLGSALIVQAHRTGARIRAGRLRQLVAEAQELQARIKPWMPKHLYKEISSVVLKSFLASIANVRDSDMVTPERRAEPALRRSLKQCASCGVGLIEARLCSACKTAAYCSRECQKRHWKEGGHKAECAALASQRGG